MFGDAFGKELFELKFLIGTRGGRDTENRKSGNLCWMADSAIREKGDGKRRTTLNGNK